tara:strand:- start:940 stop:1071 length:132 start_codon:yes stop_codon:yes gene_type:complete
MIVIHVQELIALIILTAFSLTQTHNVQILHAAKVLQAQLSKTV